MNSLFGVMKWKLLLVLLATLILAVNSRKHRQENRALGSKSNAFSAIAGARNPLDKQGGRLLARQKQGNAPSRQTGIKSATVDGSVIAESSGEGGLVGSSIGSGHSRRKSKKSRATRMPGKFAPAFTGIDSTDSRSGAGAHQSPPGVPLFSPEQWTDLFDGKSGIISPINPPGYLISNSKHGSVSPQTFPSYFRPQVIEAPRIQGMEAPRIQGIEVPRIQSMAVPRIQSMEVPRMFLPPNPQGLNAPNQQYLPFTGQAAPGPFIPYPFPDMYGTGGGQYGYYGAGPHIDPGVTSVNGANGLQNAVGTGLETGAGSFYGGMNKYGYAPPIYGTNINQPQYIARNAPYQTGSGFHQEMRKSETHNKSSTPIGSPSWKIVSSSGSLVPDILLEKLLSQKGRTEIYKNIANILWTPLEADEHRFTIKAEFTSFIPTQTVQCSAHITGSRTSGVVTLVPNESDVDCVAKTDQTAMGTR